MKPYYDHAGITIYHGFVVKCDVWTLTKERNATEQDCEGRMLPSKSRDLKKAFGNLQNTLKSGLNGAKSTTHGWVKMFRKRAGGLGRYAATEKLDLAGFVERRNQKGTILTAIPPTTLLATLQSCAGDATWKAMVA